MNKLKSVLVAWLLGSVVLQAHAVLNEGADAPDFTTQAALGGEVSSFTLSEALKKGPVVVYFYPKAFTPGCNIEARKFAEATEAFAAMNATVIGISNDDIDVLKKFSVEECRSKFAVGADSDGSIIKSYDVQLMPLLDMSSRTSYVISPDRKVFYVYKARSPDEHVKNTLEAVKRLQNR